MVPFITLITFNIKKVRVKRLHAGAELLPVFKVRLQNFLNRVIGGSVKERYRVYSVQLVILLYTVHLAFSMNSVNINFIKMVSRKYFIVAYVF